MKDYIQSYINHKTRNKSTIELYTRVLESLAEEYGKDLPFISPEEASAYEIKLKSNYANNTVIRDLRVIKAFYNHLHATQGYENPFKKIIPPPQEMTFLDRTRLLTEVELDLLLEEARKNIKQYAIVLLLVTSRFIPCEIQNLRYGDLIVDAAGRIGAYVKSRGGEKRFIPIREDVFEIILRYRQSEGLSPEIIPDEYDDSVFTNISNLRVIINKLVASAGIKKKISPKDLSHLSIIIGLLNGASMSQAEKQAGFKRKLMLRKYTKILPELQDPMCDHICILDPH